MKKVCLNDKFCMTEKFLLGQISLLLGKIVAANGKDSVKEDGRYYEFSDGERVHTRWAVGDPVCVAMSYEKAGLDRKIFGGMAGWTDKSRVNPVYMPFKFIVEHVRCVHVQDLTEEEALRAGVYKNAGGNYMVGGALGGWSKDWREMFRLYFERISNIPYAMNPWVIVYDVTPVVPGRNRV